GHVVEPGGVEVGPQLAVEDRQQVAVEGRGDARGVVVGGLQALDRLDQVGGQEERVVRGEQGRDLGEEGTPLGRDEVADGAAQEGEEAGAVGLGHGTQVVVEVADHRVHVDAVGPGDLPGGPAQRPLGDV